MLPSYKSISANNYNTDHMLGQSLFEKVPLSNKTEAGDLVG